MFKPLGSGRGILSLNSKEIATPNFIAPTIRGVVPHLTPDSYRQIAVGGIFAEHFVDQHGFTLEAARSAPLNAEISLVAARPPNSILLQKPNKDDQMGLSTFQGSQLVSIDSLAQTINELNGQIVVSPHDAPNKPERPGKNRVRKMEKRSEDWYNKIKQTTGDKALILASVVPEIQNLDYVQSADGVYCADPDMEFGPEKLRVCASRLSLGEISKLIGKFDLFYTNIDELTEKGHALIDPDNIIDLHDTQFAQDMQILGSTGYTKAYVHHLLNAREMTAMVILQQNNLAVAKEYFRRLHTAADA